MAITYSKLKKTVGLSVKLDRRKVGEIVPVNEGFRLLGWRYEPKAMSGPKYHGETFPTVEGVKRSLEQEPDAVICKLEGEDGGTFTQHTPTPIEELPVHDPTGTVPIPPHERPDLPHDTDCTYRIGLEIGMGACECSCNKDSRLETIDITPVGCQTQEGNARVNEALAIIDSLNARVADLATQMVDRLAKNEQWLSRENDILKDAVRRRKGAYDRLLRAVAGHPDAK